jgi:hypothetical protein
LPPTKPVAVPSERAAPVQLELSDLADDGGMAALEAASRLDTGDASHRGSRSFSIRRRKS